MPEVKEIFKKETKSLSDYLILVTMGAKSYQGVSTNILKFLVTEQNIPGVYVTLNKPFEIIQRKLENSSINSKLIIFIDATSRGGMQEG